ncbi:FecR/PupR family sigma factor regulator [Pseudomonas sp. NPDC088444]
MDWLLRLQQAPGDMAVRNAFEQGRDTDEANAKAFRKAEQSPFAVTPMR